MVFDNVPDEFLGDFVIERVFGLPVPSSRQSYLFCGNKEFLGLYRMLRQVDSGDLFSFMEVNSADSTSVGVMSTCIPEVGKIVEGDGYQTKVSQSLSSELFIKVEVVSYLAYMNGV